MKERPILFSGPMVRALLAGTKTQTRRTMRPDGKYRLDLVAPVDGGPSHCPYGQPGDRLWVREWWAAPHAYDHLPPRLIPQDARIHYAADEALGGLLGRPSIHMPRWASRITLEIADVRVERLNDISEDDAEAEGIERDGIAWRHYLRPCRFTCTDRRMSYQTLWESINGEGSWQHNPWVWVIEFRRAGTNHGSA